MTKEIKSFQELLKESMMFLKDSDDEYNKKITKQLCTALDLNPKSIEPFTTQQFSLESFHNGWCIHTHKLKKGFNLIRVLEGKQASEKLDIVNRKDEIDEMDLYQGKSNIIVFDHHGDGISDLVFIPIQATTLVDGLWLDHDEGQCYFVVHPYGMIVSLKLFLENIRRHFRR